LFFAVDGGFLHSAIRERNGVGAEAVVRGTALEIVINDWKRDK
jgi:hypothetical protein